MDSWSKWKTRETQVNKKKNIRTVNYSLRHSRYPTRRCIKHSQPAMEQEEENQDPRETSNKTRAKSSYGTCDEARRTKSQEIIWYEL